MKKTLKIIEHNGYKWWEEDVTKDKKFVGKSGTRIPEPYTCESGVDMYGSKQLLDLAMAQLRTNHRNSVRGGKLGIKASDIVDAVVAKKLDASEIQSNAKVWNCDFTTAGIRMLTPEVDGNQITFFLPTRIDEPDSSREVAALIEEGTEEE